MNAQVPTATGFSIWIPGRPRPQPRARLGARHAYDDGRADPWKDLVRRMATAAIHAAPAGTWPLTGAVRVDLTFVLPGEPTAKPDLDNLEKAVLDALGSSRAGGDTSKGRGRWAPLLWNDDAQVVELSSRKRRGEPGLRMTVTACIDVELEGAHEAASSLAP